MKKLLFGVTGALLLAGISSLMAQSETETGENQLLLPEDLSAGQSENDRFEELRIGGRLERVIVRRKNGFVEIYQNQRGDTIWFSEEDALGDTKNVRQWRIGTW